MKRVSSGAFAFDVDVVVGGRSTSVTVVYVSSALLSGREAGVVLAEHFEGASYPDQIWILGPADRQDQIIELCENKDLLDRVPGITRYNSSPNLVPVLVDKTGILVTPEGVALDAASVEGLFASGLVAIFKTHNGMLDARAGFHYVKPSNRHSDRFLRTANVLLYGSEIEFIAASILRRVSGRVIRRLYTDTSSINSVALSLADLLARLRGDVRATVDSFSSYRGLDSQFIVEPDEYSFALISASTSGGLVEKLETERKIARDQQLMLYYVGPPIDPHLVLQNLTTGTGLGFIDPFQSWEAKDCPLCAQNQSTVVIDGDQFLPASPTISGRMITAKDAPTWLNDFMLDVAGKGIVTCRPGSRTFYFELSEVLDGAAGQFSRQLESAIERHAPAATKWIVHLADPDSGALAEAIRLRLQALGIDVALERVVSSTALTEGTHSRLEGGVVFVVASTVVSGREVLSVSRALRSLHEGQPISYFIALMRMVDQRRQVELESNLVWGSRGREFDVNHVKRIYIPSERESEESPWGREAEFWRSLKASIQSADETPDRRSQLEAINNRIRVIGSGPIPELFLADIGPDGSFPPLSLRPNFAFWNFKLGEDLKASQADVFLTMSSVLHSMRGSRQGGASLNRDHNWTVVDPRNFSRYNDAVIQASLLRAALPHELDYSSDPAMSHQMQSVIESALQTSDPDESAIRAEYLLALCMRTLRLTDSDEDRMAKPLKDLISEDGSLLSALASHFAASIPR